MVERPSEAATGSPTLDVNRVRRDPAGSPVKEWVAGVTAGPGEAGWNPVDAHTRQKHPAAPPSIPSKGIPPGEGTFLLRRLCRNSCHNRGGTPHQARGAAGRNVV